MQMGGRQDRHIYIHVLNTAEMKQPNRLGYMTRVLEIIKLQVEVGRLICVCVCVCVCVRVPVCVCVCV